MKLVHISDLHIGKRVHEFSMLEDQKYILEQILDIIRREAADGVLLAGDIYDKTVPSAEAVQTVDHFLTELSRDGFPVYMVSGNHDSPERLSFGAELLAESRIYISPVYDGKIQCVTAKDEYGPVNIYLLPFLKPAVVRHALEGTHPCEITTYQEALEAALGQVEPDVSLRNVLVAHQFVTGAGRSDSEEVSVGGLDNVDGAVFAPFDYVALGHIHNPQYVGRETVRYSGTPLKHSFSEAPYGKSVTVVELREKGNLTVRTVPLVPLRDMRVLRGTYLEVTDRKAYTPENKEDYLQIVLTDEEDVPNGMEKLRTIYPNLMRLTYDNRRTRENRELRASDPRENKSELELFEEFYEQVNNEPICEEQRAFLEKMIREIQEESL
ncbi:MAG: exonuclease SbcCD subunit D [Clostridiales bacterium]|nr:exonuclease SbcCD subunit D [Clostridiales bacterium]